MNPQNEHISLHPIGYLITDQDSKYQLSPQPNPRTQTEGLIELERGRNFDVCLRDLNGFSRIWLIWAFHKNKSWRPTTLPPRGRTGRKGTFSTRSPYRPNPIGMSCVELLSVRDHTVRIGPHDLLSGTPILDIKPYIPEFDSFPEAKAGWFDDLQSELSTLKKYTVNFGERQVDGLKSLDAQALKSQITDILESDPLPHRTRRILATEDGYRLSCGDWRIHYQIDNDEVLILDIRLRDTL